MTADPIGYGGGMNMYAYVGGDPINSVDPTGLEAEAFGPEMCALIGMCNGPQAGRGDPNSGQGEYLDCPPEACVSFEIARLQQILIDAYGSVDAAFDLVDQYYANMSQPGGFGFPALAGKKGGLTAANEGSRTIFLDSKDPLYNAAMSTQPQNGEYLIIGHGNKTTQTMAHMTGAQMADYLRRNTNWQPGQNVRLDACWMGMSKSGFAQQLANELRVNVIASPVRTLVINGESSPWHAAPLPFTNNVMPIWQASWETFTPQ